MSNFASIRERIAEYLLFKGISRYRFYKDTGLSNGFLDKAGSINSDNCEKICYCYPEINPEWLLTGKGEMLKSGELAETEKSDKQASIEVLVQKIVELSSENTMLKKENETLRSITGNTNKVIHNPIDEDDAVDGIAAEPSV
ncbi:MAG: bZIP transcription factor [Paludibacter sp.]|nr:bZIP transcription factor [Paludibacter sp.]MDD4197836.1 bZIP transcription factor [Paludibacter sp.]MDD4427879.1 bZIP transcription factor [Paludibacter sp.]